MWIAASILLIVFVLALLTSQTFGGLIYFAGAAAAVIALIELVRTVRRKRA